MPKRKIESVSRLRIEDAHRTTSRVAKVYFPSEERLRKFIDLMNSEYEAGRLATKSLSALLYSLACRYERERRAAAEMAAAELAGEARR